MPFERTDLISMGRFDVRRLEPASLRWRQFGLLVVGLLGLTLAHNIAQWPNDSTTPTVRLWVAAVVVASLLAMGCATVAFVNSVEHGRSRVFRWPHLLAAGLTLVVIAVVLVAWLVTRGPFELLLSRGEIAGEDISDLGEMIAVALCLVGAISALIAAAEAFHDERRWRRPVRIRR